MKGKLTFRCVANRKGLLLHALFAFPLIWISPLLAQQSSPTNEGNSSQTSASSPTREYPQSGIQSALPNAPSASRPSPNAVSFDQRLRLYRHSVFSPYSFLGTPFGAAIGQWEDEPPEWGQGAKGYFHRFGSGVARHIVSQTIRFGVAAADGEDPRYHPARSGGVWKRSLHAVSETFTSRTASGTRIPAFSRFAGAYGAATFSNLWYPDSRTTTGYVLRRGSTALASSIAIHLLEEFFPLGQPKPLHESSSQPNQDTNRTTMGDEDKKGDQ